MTAQNVVSIESFNVTAVFSSLMINDKTSDLDWLSINPDNVKKYAEDPLCGQPLSLAGIRDLISIGILACDKMWPSTIPFGLPIMIISGPVLGYAIITSIRAYQDWKRRNGK